jgi:hypothetical protein
MTKSFQLLFVYFEKGKFMSIQVAHISKTYEQKALYDISFSIEKERL